MWDRSMWGEFGRDYNGRKVGTWVIMSYVYSRAHVGRIRCGMPGMGGAQQFERNLGLSSWSHPS